MSIKSKTNFYSTLLFHKAVSLQYLSEKLQDHIGFRIQNFLDFRKVHIRVLYIILYGGASHEHSIFEV